MDVKNSDKHVYEYLSPFVIPRINYLWMETLDVLLIIHNSHSDPQKSGFDRRLISYTSS